MAALNLYQKLLKIQSEIKVVAKDLKIQVSQNNSYNAVGEAAVLEKVKPLEEKYGIFSYPCGRDIIDSGMIENTDYNGKVKKQLFERIKTIYRFVDVDAPENFIEVTTYGDGIDSGDKSVGKAMTYADKYALLKAYKIVTGDDPDQEASKDLNSYKKDEKSSAGATQTKMQTKVSREDLEKELETAVWTSEKCKHKGKRIIDTDEDYLSWYIENGYNPHIKELCKVALEMIREADLDPEDDPDMQPIDGEEGLPF